MVTSLININDFTEPRMWLYSTKSWQKQDAKRFVLFLNSKWSKHWTDHEDVDNNEVKEKVKGWQRRSCAMCILYVYYGSYTGVCSDEVWELWAVKMHKISIESSKGYARNWYPWCQLSALSGMLTGQRYLRIFCNVRRYVGMVWNHIGNLCVLCVRVGISTCLMMMHTRVQLYSLVGIGMASYMLLLYCK